MSGSDRELHPFEVLAAESAKSLTRRRVLALFGSLLGVAWAKSALAQLPKPVPGAIKSSIPSPSVAAPSATSAAGAPVTDDTSWTERRTLAMTAVVLGIQTWQTQAYFSDVSIMAVSAIGGRLNGPDLASLILARRPERLRPAIAKPFADAVGEAWTAWAATVRFCGLPLYPAFAAFPGAMAPPMPNIPVPLMALQQDPERLMPPSLGPAIRAKLGASSSEPGATDAIDYFTKDLAARFGFWAAQCQVLNLLAQGPIPTFAPPYVPVGPVVGDTVIATPAPLGNVPFPA